MMEIDFEQAKWSDDESKHLNIWMGKGKAQEIVLTMLNQIFDTDRDEVNVQMFVKDTEKGRT